MSDVGQSGLTATVVVVTRNRWEDLRAALESAVRQEGSPEVLVLDDGSTDGTLDMVRGDFPSVRLIASEAPLGYIAQRNRGAELATGDIVVSIDDDARFSADNTVAQTLEEFADPRIGAVAMPLIHTSRGPEVLQRPPSPIGVWVTNAYIGTAHAVRRDLFLSLGGYRESLEHFFEEPDFCVRLMRAGHSVRLGHAQPILHSESPRRNLGRGVHYFCRNHLLFTFFYVPYPDVLARAPAVTVHVVWHALRMREPVAGVRGMLAALAYMATHRHERSPVSRADYRRWRSLRRRPAALPEASSAISFM